MKSTMYNEKETKNLEVTSNDLPKNDDMAVGMTVELIVNRGNGDEVYKEKG